jgi:NADH oxidase (H2O-forming)
MKDINIHSLSDSVKWVGVLDYDIVTFDVVMETKYGTTYNSYFIDAEKKAVIETVKAGFFSTYLDKLRQLTDPREIRYIILNHTEPDHSGSLMRLLHEAPDATVVATGNAIRYLKDMVPFDFPHIVVKDGYTLDLGNMTLQFISAPNLHWPDTMYTYLAEEKILFTCDSFGAHYCHTAMFDDQVGNFDESFRKFMLKAIHRIKGLDINIIAPGHGPILRSDWRKYVSLSEHWAEKHMELPSRHKIYIPFVSAYHNTGLLAEKIAEGLRMAGDFNIEISDIEKAPIGELEQKVTESAAIIVGSTTINQNILLPVYRLFSVINPLRDKGKMSGGFGSFGWSGESREIIKSNLEILKLKYFGDGVFVKFSPNEDEQALAVAYGKAFGQALLAKELESAE